jgi:hypothetical protein
MYHAGIYMEGLNKAKRSLSGVWCFCRDLIWSTPEYESENLKLPSCMWRYCHMCEWLQTRFELVIGFIAHLHTQLRCWVRSSRSRRSSALGLTSSQADGHFTTTSCSSNWIRESQSESQILFRIGGRIPYVTSSLMRGWVCRLQLLLAFASAVILRSESRETHGQILLSQIRGSSNLEEEVLIFISPRNRVDSLRSQALGSLFVASYDSQGYGGSIRTRLPDL